MAPLPWKVARDVGGATGVGVVRRGTLEYPSDFVGYEAYAAARRGSIGSWVPPRIPCTYSRQRSYRPSIGDLKPLVRGLDPMRRLQGEASVATSWRPNWVGFVLGLVIAGVALSVTLGSYEGASRGGGSYVVLWGAVLAGAALAVRSVARTQNDIEADGRRRVGDANATLVKRTMSPGEWETTKSKQSALAGSMLSDGEVATRVLAKNRASARDDAARWRANAAKAHAPILRKLKASMTAAEWEAKRDETTEDFRWSRRDAARYWLENSAPLLPKELRSLPDHLNPALVTPAEDWQVAMHLRPIKLDNDGNPRPKV